MGVVSFCKVQPKNRRAMPLNFAHDEISETLILVASHFVDNL